MLRDPDPKGNFPQLFPSHRFHRIRTIHRRSQSALGRSRSRWCGERAGWQGVTVTRSPQPSPVIEKRELSCFRKSRFEMKGSASIWRIMKLPTMRRTLATRAFRAAGSMLIRSCGPWRERILAARTDVGRRVWPGCSALSALAQATHKTDRSTLPIRRRFILPRWLSIWL